MSNPSGNMMPRSEHNFPNNAKKLPNPANFKIVKCKNFERGKKYIKKIIIKISFFFLMNFTRWKLQIWKYLHFRTWRY